MFKKILGSSWLTSVIGMGGGAAYVGLQGWTTPEGKLNWNVLIPGLLFALIGRLAKDAHVTGGTKVVE